MKTRRGNKGASGTGCQTGTPRNPGRHQFDESQELNYSAICKAIAGTGFQGYLAHEYSPARGLDPLDTLEKMMRICEVRPRLVCSEHIRPAVGSNKF
jgi:hypothetical protein